MHPGRPVLWFWVLVALADSGGQAQIAPSYGSSPVAEKAFRHPGLYISNLYEPVAGLPLEAASRAREELAELRIPAQGAFLDVRGGRWGSLLPAEPLLPGGGVGNDLTWASLGLVAPDDPAGFEDVAWDALTEYLHVREQLLGIEVDELWPPANVTVHDAGRRIQIYAQRVFRGVSVRDSYLTAVINNGNLVLLGVRNWGDIGISTAPGISEQSAVAAVAAHLEPTPVDGYRSRPELTVVPMGVGDDLGRLSPGRGYQHRLAWVVRPEIREQLGRWEALVDARTGELLALQDSNRYATTRNVVGGVYPVSNDGTPPDGVEQPGYPMPFADVTDAGTQLFTDSGGNYPVCVDGPITTTLAGELVRIDDFCGAISESSSGDIDLGTGGGRDCDLPPGASSPGDTHAARTGFYELNRVKEMALGHLPGNPWLRDQLAAVTNIPDFGVPEFNCNAFWDEVTVNFFTSGASALPGVVCSNTGEIAGVLDHEWGHGLDNNDALPSISNPGEGIADVYAALRLNESCIGRGFYTAGNQCGDDDPCIDCDGVRDIDWAERQSGQPHDIAWIDANCAPPFLGDPGPCGGGIHCEGAVYSEAIWDLVHRDLQGPPFAMDLNTALEMGTRLTFLGAGGVGNWYSCVDGAGTGDGCNADGGYLNFLAIDDDNGDLNDGTPHMAAIFSAFDRHGIACGAPPVQNSGCSGAPAEAPTVSATALDRGVQLIWSPVTGATEYEVLRTEGVFGCEFGKIKVGQTPGTQFLSAGLRNGFAYSYIVVPLGGDPACTGPASACTAVTPAAGANLAFAESSISLQVLNGDLDSFIDNCEVAELTFDLVNIGSAPLTNLRLLDVEVVSHPGTVTVTTAFPVVVAPSLAECGLAPGGFAFTAEGLSFNDTVEFRVDATSDELAGMVRSQTIRLVAAESSLESFASKTFTFETDLENWQTARGTFAPASAGGGAAGSSWYVASSANLPDQCDVIRSPSLQLSSTSTLSLWNQFDIEPSTIVGGSEFWYDRANLGIVDAQSGRRTPVSPDGGRTYNATGSGGSCGTNSQDGWADAGPGWAESTWSAAALGSATLAGELVQLGIRYGTDPFEQGFGFWFDEVTVTDVGVVVADGQTDACLPGNSPPVALDDSVSVTTLDPVTIAVLENDSDPDPGDGLRILAVTQPSRGTAVIDFIGPDLDTITYTPNAGSGGVDTFLYSVTDGNGGSDIATVTIDSSVMFLDGFESGDVSAWSGTQGLCDPNGSYTVSGAPIQYSCCFGLVDLTITSFTFASDGAEISSAPSNPVLLTGAPTTCPAGAFSNSGVLPGSCAETYALVGGFTGPDDWSGTYSMTFSGPDCSCLDLDPCLDQTFTIDAAR